MSAASSHQQLKPSTSFDSLEGVPSRCHAIPAATTVTPTTSIGAAAAATSTLNVSKNEHMNMETILSTQSVSSLASLSTAIAHMSTPSTATATTSLHHNNIVESTTSATITESKSTKTTASTSAAHTLNDVTIFSPATNSSTSSLPPTPTKVDDGDDDFDTKHDDYQVGEMSEAEIDALYGDDEHLFSVGDHVRIYKRALGLWPFYHHGIVTAIRVVAREGRAPRHEIEKIVHFTHRNHRQRQVICETNLAHFAHGALDALQPVHHEHSRYPLLVAAKRARQKIGCTRYHPVQRNCEHFATWCHTGRENSSQIRSYAQMAIALSWGAVLGLTLNSLASSDASSSSSSGSSGGPPK